MKIVLVRPNYDSHIITPPLGLGYLSAELKRHHFQSKIIDGLKENLELEPLVEKITEQKPDVVGITCLTAFYNQVISLAQILKKKGYKVVIGGVHPTFLPLQTLKDSGADFVVCGEGEISFIKLLKSGFKNKNIKGVYSLKDFQKDRLIEKSEAFEDLDYLPFPDWQEIDPRTYPAAPHGAIAKNFPIGIIMTTRGCPYMCSFCASPQFYDRKIRFRSPEKVIREIKYLVKNFAVKEIHFEDDNLTLKKEHVESICNLIIKNDIKISWACPNGIRADRVDRQLLELMKKSGCYYIAFGIESANPQILKNIHKLETIETIEKSIKLANEIGFQTQGFFIFGLPGENKKTIRENMDFAKKSKLARAQFIILDVLPGSELWNTLKGKFKPNWNKKSYKEPEWIPKGLTKDYLQESQAKAFREFYFRPIIFFRLARFIRPRQITFLLKRLKEYRIIKIGDQKDETTKNGLADWDIIFRGAETADDFKNLVFNLLNAEERELILKRFNRVYQNTGSNNESQKLKKIVKNIKADIWAEKWSNKIKSSLIH